MQEGRSLGPVATATPAAPVTASTPPFVNSWICFCLPPSSDVEGGWESIQNPLHNDYSFLSKGHGKQHKLELENVTRCTLKVQKV